jgi:hypothetical protein
VVVSAIGFPVFRHSAATSSSERDSMASAIRRRARLRSEGVASRHLGKAALATAKAASTSARDETGASA